MTGIHLGQLPPAEVARLKAELAETIIANFCYPRFFDYRTNSLRMRPVDRAKRQEVWLYLSSVDFTAWNRIDLMSPDFQRSIERLFIQFVQRNRSFFGEQGRKRMSDIRMLITSTSTTVAQGLRNHITGQRKDRQGVPPFGSPRQAVSWAVLGKGHSEPAWEQIVTTTMLLQQQMQELRGEVKVPMSANESLATPSTSSSPRRTNRASSSRVEQEAAQPSGGKAQKNTHATTSPLQGTKSTSPLNPTALPNAAPQRPATPLSPAASVASSTATPVWKHEISTPVVPTTDEPLSSTPIPLTKSTEPSDTSRSSALVQTSAGLPPTSPMPATPIASVTPVEDTRNSLQPTAPTAPLATSSTTMSKRENRDGAMMQVGDDDIAIFEQMRHQLVIWLRVEAVHSGLEIADQSPSQLLEMLRQQERYDDTRLQVVSTLLNLANQVIKNGRVSVLDYKQALMFHLMHTRR
ncbi:MAG: hypothetical protein PVSMB2_04480 [Ktedonobacteraceae bacterium]